MTDRAAALRVNLVHYPVATLGPGVRALIVVQGCARGCPGCVAPHTWDPAGGRAESIVALIEKLKAFKAEGAAGLTLTGGEPFDQPEGLQALLSGARAAGFDDVLVYSGYRRDDLAARFSWLPDLVDALVDGPFERDRPTDFVWKGSENQALHVFARDPATRERYAAHARRRGGKRELTVVETAGGIHVVGIPDAREAERMRDGLA